MIIKAIILIVVGYVVGSALPNMIKAKGIVDSVCKIVGSICEIVGVVLLAYGLLCFFGIDIIKIIKAA